MNRVWLRRAVVLVPFALAALAYSSSLTGAFQYDDDRSVAHNLAIRDLGSFVRDRFLREYLRAARPVTELTFALDYRIGGLEVLPYHATNVLLHLVVMGLVFLLTRRTLRRLDWPAAGGLALWIAGVFGLHPIQSQAVSYVSQRAEVLASLFYLLALLLWLEAEDRGAGPRGVACYLGALLSFLLGLGSKPIVATLPVAFLAYRLYFPPMGPGEPPAVLPLPPGEGRGEGERQVKLSLSPRAWSVRLALAAPFFLASAASTAVYFTSLRGSAEVGFDLPSLGPWRYFLTQLRVLLRYLQLLVWPAGQNLDYAFPPSGGILEPRTLASGVLILALAIAAVVLGRRSNVVGPLSARAARLASFGIAWFFVVLAPTSSFIPIVDVIEEHRAYLASWGILAALAAVASAGFARLAGGGARARRAEVALALCVWGALGAALLVRNEVWATRLSLWRDVVAKSPTKARGRANLADALYKAGDTAGAVEQLRAALPLACDGSVPRSDLTSNLGLALLKLDRIDEAIGVMNEALADAPDDTHLLNGLAIALQSKGDMAGAAVRARQAIATSPHHGGAHETLGEVLLNLGDLEGAHRELGIASELDPRDAFRAYMLATVQERLRLPQACATWSRYLAMGPGPMGQGEARSHLAALGCGAR